MSSKLDTTHKTQQASLKAPKLPPGSTSGRTTTLLRQWGKKSTEEKCQGASQAKLKSEKTAVDLTAIDKQLKLLEAKRKDLLNQSRAHLQNQDLSRRSLRSKSALVAAIREKLGLNKALAQDNDVEYRQVKSLLSKAKEIEGKIAQIKRLKKEWIESKQPKSSTRSSEEDKKTQLAKQATKISKNTIKDLNSFQQKNSIRYSRALAASRKNMKEAAAQATKGAALCELLDYAAKKGTSAVTLVMTANPKAALQAELLLGAGTNLTKRGVELAQEGLASTKKAARRLAKDCVRDSLSAAATFGGTKLAGAKGNVWGSSAGGAFDAGLDSVAQRGFSAKQNVKDALLGAALGGSVAKAGQLLARLGRYNAAKVLREPAAEQVEDFVKSATKKGLPAPKAKELCPKIALDPVTSFNNAPFRLTKLTEAIKKVRNSGERAVYVEADIGNLNGLNAKLGHSRANEVFAEIAAIFKKELSTAGKVSLSFRHGGDEISAIVYGTKSSVVEKRLQRVATLIEERMRQRGLHDLPHSKAGRLPGVRLCYGHAEINPGVPAEKILAAADQKVERMKLQGTGLELLQINDTSRAGPNIAQPRMKLAHAALEHSATKQATPLGVFAQPEEVAFENFCNEAKRLGLRLSRQDLLELFPKIERDMVTPGFFKKELRIPTLQRALDFRKKNTLAAFYVEADIINLGGLNQTLGHSGANTVFNRLSTIFKEELEAAGPLDAVFFRHGGDEISATVIGPREIQLRQALKNCSDRIDDYISRSELSKIPHTKLGRPSGTGMNIGYAEIQPSSTIEQVMATADQRIEQQKKIFTK